MIATGATGAMDAMDASVVVPTHARPERLARLLASLADQTLPAARFEVIVVDDGSPPGRRPDEDALPANARLVRQDQAGPAAARNAGARLARGRLLAFVDDDCVVDAGWLAALLAAHREHPRALLGGTTCNGLPDNLLSDVAESLLGFLEEDERRTGRPLSFLASNNIACARVAFLATGGFDTSYPLAAGEDRAFCRSWLGRGEALVRVPGARVSHHHAHDLRSFWRQQRNYGRGAALFHAVAPSTNLSRAAADGEPAPAAAGTPPDAATVPAARSSAARSKGLPREKRFYVRLLLHYLRRRDRSFGRRLAGTSALVLSQAAIARGLLAERLSRR